MHKEPKTNYLLVVTAIDDLEPVCTCNHSWLQTQIQKHSPEGLPLFGQWVQQQRVGDILEHVLGRPWVTEAGIEDGRIWNAVCGHYSCTLKWGNVEFSFLNENFGLKFVKKVYFVFLFFPLYGIKLVVSIKNL